MLLPGEEKVENWQELSAGVNYRKIGTDVEINIYCSRDFTFQNWQFISLGILPEGYRPSKNTWIMLFARNGSTNKEYICRARILTSGEVQAVISTDAAITVNILTGFIKFSII